MRSSSSSSGSSWRCPCLVLISIPLITLALALVCTFTTELARRWLLNIDLKWTEIDTATTSMFVSGWKGLSYALFMVFRWALLGIFVTAGAGLMSTISGPDSPVPGFIAVIGMLLFSAAALYAFYDLTQVIFVVPTYISEGLKGKASVKRSRELKKITKAMDPGSPIGGSIAVFFILGLILYSGFGTLEAAFQISAKLTDWIQIPSFKVMAVSAISLIPGILAVWITLPYFATIVAISYFERRARKEGYDIELLVQQMSLLRR